MKAIHVPFLSEIDGDTPVEMLWLATEGLTAVALKAVPWVEFPYRPSVYFRIAHTDVGILLRYDVEEKYVQAVYQHPNDPVYKDSCVEFFLSFDKVHYYNMEFNSLGAGLIGYGPAAKPERKRLSAATIEQVRTDSRISAQKLPSGDTAWQLLLHIPLTVFAYDRVTSLSGLFATGNFYKCGDDLPDPHYVAWSPIKHPTPNFHLPQFFGILRFE